MRAPPRENEARPRVGTSRGCRASARIRVPETPSKTRQNGGASPSLSAVTTSRLVHFSALLGTSRWLGGNQPETFLSAFQRARMRCGESRKLLRVPQRWRTGLDREFDLFCMYPKLGPFCAQKTEFDDKVRGPCEALKKKSNNCTATILNATPRTSIPLGGSLALSLF